MALDKNKTVWQRTRLALIKTGIPHTERELDAWTDIMHSYVIDERRDVGMSALEAGFRPAFTQEEAHV
ncbi:MAG: hypothetical protein ACTH4Y_08200 [Microbacterium gubbeenense]|uniref:hypothetical protein n=1 Tax=Microbacterium gubbeenense TaxID=159896 RepID=UPI003F971A35